MLFDRVKLRTLKANPAYRYIAIPRRAITNARYVLGKLPRFLGWVFSSREENNFTYDLSDQSLLYLAHVVAQVADCDPEVALGYINELRDDAELQTYLVNLLANSAYSTVSDRRVGYGRRLGWYALVRLLKPKVVIETGVDKGLGSAVLCAALLHNRAEGAPGRYYGTDIEPAAGWLLKAPYNEVGELLIGDSIESLKAFPEKIDLFINDSDHSAEYEAREYETIMDKLAKGGVVLGDNAHVTGKLAEFSLAKGRGFLYFQEFPRNHWYPGAGIGISFVGRGKAGANAAALA